MSTPTIERAPGASSPQQPDERPEQQAAPSRLAVLARDPRVLALAFAVLVVVVSAALGGSGVWPKGWAIDIKSPLNDLDNWLVDNRETSPVFLYFLLHISNGAESSVDGIVSLFDAMGWIGVTTVGTLVGWAAGGSDLSRRALRTGGTTLGVFIACGVLNMWTATMETLALMTVAVFASAVLGLLLGLGAGLSDRFERILRPVFDTMQVMPAFAYLLPLLLIFGVGVPSALIATVIYAAPPMARLTSLGLRSADPAALEASASLGASSWQRLWTARLPLARKQMMLGLNQAIMMCLSMVVLASLIGSEGLGDEIYQALGSLDVGTALTAGVAVVLIAVLLDRTTAAAGERLDATVTVGATRLMTRVRRAVWGLIVVLIGLFSAIGSALAEREWPDAWTVDLTRPLQDAVDWLTATIGHGVPVLGGTEVWAKGFTIYVLNPLRSGLETTPWWALALLVGVIGWIVGTWRAALTAVICLCLIGAMGLWEISMDTFSQVIAGLVVTMAIGIVLGVLAARIERVERMLRPVLDTMQTMPQFVYLIPVIALVGLSRSAGIIAAVIYACPAVIRITAQGLRYVDPAAMEAARSLGATSKQQLLGVQLPLARKSLLVGVNQGVVLVLSMVVIAGLIGGGALGYDVVRGLSKGDLSLGLPAGIAIVCLGIMLDRISQPAGGRPRE